MTSKEYVTLKRAFIKWSHRICSLRGQNAIKRITEEDKTIPLSDCCFAKCDTCSFSYGIKRIPSVLTDEVYEHEHHEEICAALLKWKSEQLDSLEELKRHDLSKKMFSVIDFKNIGVN